MPKRAVLAVVCGLSVVAGAAVPAQADLIVNVGSASVPSGGTGTVDVYVTSTSADSFAVTSLSFNISRTSGASLLEFTNSQSNSFLNQPNYVFAGDSFDYINSIPFFGPPSTTVTPNDTISGGDNTNDFMNVTLTTGLPYLVAALTVQSQTGAAAGDSFSFSLNPGSTYLGADLMTQVPYTSTPGTITITPAFSTPEPGTWTLLISGGGFLFWWRRRTRGA